MKITVQTGSIVDASVGAHAIVNAGNPDLGLGGGVSGAIRDACGGHPFQVEVREQLAEEFDHPLEPSDCLSTSGGTSSAFRWVLHVASVDYRKPDPQTGGASGPNRIRACTQAFLEEAIEVAEAHDLSGRFVLATPLLGAGHGGLGPILAMDVMCEAMKRFLRQSPRNQETLAKLVIVLPKEQDARAFAHAASKHGLPIDGGAPPA